MNSGLGRQEGGSHYTDMAIQPLEFIMENCSAKDVKWVFVHNILKYITRDKDSTLQDWKKAKHYIEIYIEFLEKDARKRGSWWRRLYGGSR